MVGEEKRKVTNNHLLVTFIRYKKSIDYSSPAKPV